MKKDKKETEEELIAYAAKRTQIKEPEKVKLWVRSGGRCAVCNKYLLDEIYGTNIGEMAHIVGWSTAPNSPRGKNDLSMEGRNFAENLILLCGDHHPIIDDKPQWAEFSVEVLMEMKKAHEERIHHQTSLTPNSESLILRMFGGIRGLVVELSQMHARKVILHSEKKFPRFLSAFDKQSIEIDLHSLSDPEDEWDTYWSMGKKIIDKQLVKVREGIESGEIKHISLFALSRIPLMVYLGYQLGDKVPTSLYQKHRGDEETWLWSEKHAVERFKIVKVKACENHKVALLLSLSGTTNQQALPAEIAADHNIYEITPESSIPNPGIFRNKQSLQNFEECYRQFLSQTERDHRACGEIHVFGAIPVTAALVTGRAIMRSAQPPLVIHDLSKNGYLPAIIINKQTNETYRLL